MNSKKYKNSLKNAAEILNRLNHSDSKRIINEISKEDSFLASQLKKNVNTIEDLLKLTNRDMQKLLTYVEDIDIILSFKTSSESVRNKVLQNVSKRRREKIQSDFKLLGPRRLKEINDSQNRIIDKMLAMVNKKEIFLCDEDMVE